MSVDDGTMTVGIMTDAISGARKVYCQLDGHAVAMSPKGARKMAKRLRSSGDADLIDMATELDTLALEIEQEKGAA